MRKCYMQIHGEDVRRSAMVAKNDQKNISINQ